MATRIAINGYGRIGRDLHRQVLHTDDIEVVAINSRADANSHAYLLKYDSLYAKCDAEIEVVDAETDKPSGDLMVNGKRVVVLQVANPADLDWAKYDVDIVIESTGKFTKMEHAQKHLDAGAKKVLITAPCKEMEIPNVVMGVNNQVDGFSPDDYKVVSNASCTTNCLAPVLKVLNDEFKVEKAFATTLHAFTHTQNLLDNSNEKDFRRARATTESIIPTTTGAMEAIHRVIPELKGKVTGMAFRVPVPTVSCIDMIVKLEKEPSVEEINSAFVKHERGDLAGVLGTTDEPLVSVDFRGDSRSSIVDLASTKILPGGYAQVISWYDNEWGYVSRVVDLIRWFR